MNEWIFLFTGLMAGGIVAYFWQKRIVTGERARQETLLSDAETRRINAEREKSNAEVMLKAKCDEIEQVRRDTFSHGKNSTVTSVLRCFMRVVGIESPIKVDTS